MPELAGSHLRLGRNVKYFVECGERTAEIDLATDEISIDGIVRCVDWRGTGSSSEFSLLLDNRSADVYVRRTDNGYEVHLNGRKYAVGLQDEKERLIGSLIQTKAGSQGKHEVHAPMPGLVVRLFVEVGETVAAGTPLLAIEAMKMENEIRATEGGVVSKIPVNESDSVDKGAVLMVIECV